MNIGILGSGDVGKSLGAGFVERGDEVMLGTRDPAKLKDWQAAHPSAKVGSFAETAQFGDLVVLSTNAAGAIHAIELAGKNAFDGKIVIDTTNPVEFDAKGPHLTVAGNDSMGERVQAALSGARVVKAFNTVGAALMVKPSFKYGPPSMFIAGNDDAAKGAVSEIVRDFGWDVVDLGGIEASRMLEAMCLAWIVYAVRNQGRNHAFKLLR